MNVWMFISQFWYFVSISKTAKEKFLLNYIFLYKFLKITLCITWLPIFKLGKTLIITNQLLSVQVKYVHNLRIIHIIIITKKAKTKEKKFGSSEDWNHGHNFSAQTWVLFTTEFLHYTLINSVWFKCF